MAVVVAELVEVEAVAAATVRVGFEVGEEAGEQQL